VNLVIYNLFFNILKIFPCGKIINKAVNDSIKYSSTPYNILKRRALLMMFYIKNQEIKLNLLIYKNLS